MSTSNPIVMDDGLNHKVKIYYESRFKYSSSPTCITSSTPSVNPYFHVILLPTQSNDSPTKSEISTTNGSCFQIAWSGYYDYSLFRYGSGTVSASNLVTDGKLTQVRKTTSGQITSFSMGEGTNLTDNGTVIVQTYGVIGTVMYSGANVIINGSVSDFSIYAPNATSVVINGVQTNFVKAGNYVESTTVSHSRTWSGIVTANSNITVASGITLTISAGSTPKFTSGVSLTVNGVLNAQGTLTTPIQFTAVSTTSPWSSVNIYNGSSILKYCIFEYANQGLTLNNASAGNTIENCTFRNNVWRGISIENGSKATVKKCEVKNNQYGVYCSSNVDVRFIGDSIHHNSYQGVYSSSGNLLQFFGTVIQNNSGYGLVTANSDIVRLGQPYSWEGYNTVRYNRSTEVYAASGSPTVTLVTASVHDTTANGLEVYNTSGNPQIYTSNCYWDVNGCQYSGSVSFNVSNNNLPTWDGQTRTAGSPLGKVSAPVVPDNILWFYDPRIPDAEKVARCKDIITKNPSAEDARTALIWLYIILRTDYAENQLGEKSTFFSYLQGLRKNYAATPLGGQALRYMIFWKTLEKSDATAIELSKEAMKILTGEEKKWVMAELAHAYARRGQLQEAKGALQGMRDEYGKDGELIALIEQDIAMEEGMMAKGIWTPEESEKSSELELEIPTGFDLVQNYPNPFNPSTVISYQLKAISHVTLKIYDMLGREVVTLADGTQEAGSYSATFHGDRLASGIYFARFVASPEDGNKPFTKIVKMLLMK